MARDPQKFKLGVFVLAGIAVLLGGIVILGAGKLFRESVTLYCYFDENVSGLDAGSPVSYRGVRIGEVAEVRLVRLEEGAMRPDAPIEVRCAIYPDLFGDQRELWVTQSEFEERVQVLVARGMRAAISWKDITGQKYIALDYFQPSEQPVPDLGIEPREPYIPTAQTATLADIQRDLATVASKLAHVDYEEISTRIVQLLEITTQRIESIDTQALAGHAEETLVAIRQLAENEDLHRAIARFDEIAEHAESVLERADELVHKPELDEAIADATASVRSMATTMSRIEQDVPRIVEKVESVVAEAEAALADADVPGTAGSLRGAADAVGEAAREIAGMRTDMQRARQEFGRASRSIDRLTRALSEDPGVLLRGRETGRE